VNRISAALGHLLPATLAFFTPQSGGSPNANQIDTLYKITLYIALVIFIAVEGGLAYALLKFRARRGAVAAQIRGNTRLEVGWTVAAAVILLVLAVITFAKLSSIQDPPNSGPGGAQLASGGPLYASAERKLPANGKSLNITVIGRQYIWQYVNPTGSAPPTHTNRWWCPRTPPSRWTSSPRTWCTPGGSPSWGASSRRSPDITTTPGSRSANRGSTAGSARCYAGAATPA
jgi:cytochrome c oxidase subunit 2